ncbi:MAG: type I pullulanase, partial [Planctomycetota bacterium]
VVIDLDRTDPDGWGSIATPVVDPKTDEIVYEIHVRDYSVADESAPEDIRGTYLGLIHENESPVMTGLSHLKELGVTAVHLLPIQDFTNERSDYNWGYWTALFNVAEADYATNQTDPIAPITELKQTIHTLHANDIRVIMDVVYNHTSTPVGQRAFDAAVPKYYFRTTDDGEYRNDAGTGNSIADERAMVRKYIVDSLVYWTNEYRIDGYRFDLLGTHQPETVSAILAALESVREDLTIYGEPWTGGGPIYYGKGAQRGSEMAVFNDHLRNAIRGDLDGTAIGFATGPGGDRGAILAGVRGAIDDFADHPIESVAYASAHDNLTLWDKIIKTAPDADEATHRSMQKLALGVVLTSQGMPFLHGGSDFARTKYGEHNSYNKGDAVNKFDWARKGEYRDVFDYVAGLIEIRKAHPAFRMHDATQVRRNLRVIAQGPAVAFALNGAAVGDPWGTIVVAYTGDPTEHGVELPPGKWTQVVNADTAGTEPLREVEGWVTLPPYSMVVLWQ